MDRTTLYNLLQRGGAKKITQTGEGFACLCFFHPNHKSPAFNINADTGLWRCWNPNCPSNQNNRNGGNLVMFLVKALHMSYSDALSYAKDLPVLSESDPSKWKLPAYDQRWAKSARKFMDEAQLGLYHRCPKYMLDRGFPKDFLREYDIGFDQQGYEHPPGSGKVIGKNRVTFPVRDPHGLLLGCTRRAVDDDWPKYLHDFDKTRTLYLLDRVVPGATIGVTEGPIDALRARYVAKEVGGTGPIFEALANMTATLGSSGDDQASLVAECRPAVVVLAFDNDFSWDKEGEPPGVTYTKKWIKLLRSRGVGRIDVLAYPSDDLGELDIEQIVEVDLVPAFRWLTQH